MADDADFATIISSELIAEIVEEYMNKTMFKKRVKIVDLSPTETGYLFSVAYADKLKVKTVTADAILDQAETIKTGTETLLHHIEHHIAQHADVQDDTAIKQILEGAGIPMISLNHQGDVTHG